MKNVCLCLTLVFALPAVRSEARQEPPPAPQETPSPTPTPEPTPTPTPTPEPTPAPPPQEEPPVPPPQERPAKPWLEELLGVPVHGFLSGRYRLRATSDDRDQDFYEYLSADIGDPAQHRFTGHLYIRATEDLDGDTDVTGYYPFDGSTNTFSNDMNGRIYYAYADIHRLHKALETVRLGRQFLDETPFTFHLDGLRAETEKFENLRNLRLGLYGGLPVHLYESSPSGDSILGFYAEAEPWKGSHARFDYARVVDEYTLGELDNDLFGLALSQRIAERFHGQAHFNILEGNSHSLDLRGTYLVAESDLQFQLRYYQLFKTQRALTVDVDSFFYAAQEYSPYHQVRLIASKGWGKHFILEAGLDLRLLTDSGDEGPLNHEFRRYYLAPSVSDWPWPRFSGSITLEMWDASGGSDGDILTWGFDLSYKPSDLLKLSGGTSFALYKFDTFDASERENVRTFYARAVYLFNKQLKGDLYLDFEDGDFDDFWTVKVGVTQSF